MNTHTPGPWLLRETEERELISFCGPVVYTDKKLIAYPYMNTVTQYDENLANTHLIAAAPELLEALYKIDANAAESAEWIRRVTRAAIAKAEGREGE